MIGLAGWFRDVMLQVAEFAVPVQCSDVRALHIEQRVQQRVKMTLEMPSSQHH
jgi:hypothetical protein